MVFSRSGRKTLIIIVIGRRFKMGEKKDNLKGALITFLKGCSTPFLAFLGAIVGILLQ